MAVGGDGFVGCYRECARVAGELTAVGEVFGTVDIKGGIFQVDSLSPLLFVMVMIPLSMILNRYDSIKWVQLGNAKRLFNHLLFMDDLKLYAVPICTTVPS